jgi:ABC-type lipoprotein release transport system permease subunit
VPKFLAAFLALLGLGGLVHALVVTLRRSRRDVAIGRALGFTPRDARSTMRWDASTLAVAGIAVGVPAGIMAGTLAWSIVASSLGVVIRHALPWWAGAVVAGTVLVVALVFSALPGRLAGRLRPAEILRAE